MDNASPHVGRDTVQVLNAEFAAKKRDATQGVAVRNSVIPAVPDVILKTQSAQSPDVNLCDLAFFSASQMKVFKRRRQSNRLFEVDKLEADIKAEFKKYPVASLCAMWNTLARVMQKIVYAKGVVGGIPALHHLRVVQCLDTPSYCRFRPKYRQKHGEKHPPKGGGLRTFEVSIYAHISRIFPQNSARGFRENFPEFGEYWANHLKRSLVARFL